MQCIKSPVPICIWWNTGSPTYYALFEYVLCTLPALLETARKNLLGNVKGKFWVYFYNGDKWVCGYVSECDECVYVSECDECVDMWVRVMSEWVVVSKCDEWVVVSEWAWWVSEYVREYGAKRESFITSTLLSTYWCMYRYMDIQTKSSPFSIPQMKHVPTVFLIFSFFKSLKNCSLEIAI